MRSNDPILENANGVAKELGMPAGSNVKPILDALKRVEATTRERCAKAAEDLLIYTGPGGDDPERYQKAIAKAIRNLDT